MIVHVVDKLPLKLRRLSPLSVYTLHIIVYPDTSEEVSHILAKKLMENGEIRETREHTDSTSSSPSSWTRKESLNQLLKLQQMSKVPRLKGEVNLYSTGC